ncbi:MAG: hypothetical protein MK078_11995 [Crocinitomicaceae bacterium]|nr:hypothetical protein [Crocinitomicaceae bacterium]
MKKLLFFAFLAVAMIACDKNQRAVKKLEGTWNATKALTTEPTFGLTIDLLGDPVNGSMSFTFENCKLKDDEWCNVSSTISVFGDTESDNSLYKVTNDGTQIEVLDSAGTANIITIQELTNTEMKATWIDDETTIEMELEKQ